MLIEDEKKKKSDIKIHLDARSHVYTDESGNTYSSVSRIINKFSHRFDEHGFIAKRVAKKEGISVEEVKKKWQKMATDAATRGTKIHKSFERYIETQKIDKGFEKLAEKFDTLDVKGLLLTEEKIYNREHLIAGTTDLKSVIRGRTDLYDFKTNKSIGFYSKYNNKMKYPIDYLDDCEYSKYSIQLSFYAWMSEQHGEDIRRLGLIWIPPTEDKLILIPVIYMKSTVETLLRYIKENEIKI